MNQRALALEASVLMKRLYDMAMDAAIHRDAQLCYRLERLAERARCRYERRFNALRREQSNTP